MFQCIATHFDFASQTILSGMLDTRSLHNDKIYISKDLTAYKGAIIYFDKYLYFRNIFFKAERYELQT